MWLGVSKRLGNGWRVGTGFRLGGGRKAAAPRPSAASITKAENAQFVLACQQRIIGASLQYFLSHGICVAAGQQPVDQAVASLPQNDFEQIEQQLSQIRLIIEIFDSTGKVSQQKKEGAVKALTEIEDHFAAHRGTSSLPEAIDELMVRGKSYIWWGIAAIVFALTLTGIIVAIPCGYMSYKSYTQRKTAIRNATQAATVIISNPEDVAKSLK
jgi:hypothetical protein